MAKLPDKIDIIISEYKWMKNKSRFGPGYIKIKIKQSEAELFLINMKKNIEYQLK